WRLSKILGKKRLAADGIEATLITEGKLTPSVICSIVPLMAFREGTVLLYKNLPSSVSVTFRVVLLSNLTPSCVSSRCICWLIPGRETYKFFEAFVKLNVSATSIKLRKE